MCCCCWGGVNGSMEWGLCAWSRSGRMKGQSLRQTHAHDPIPGPTLGNSTLDNSTLVSRPLAIHSNTLPAFHTTHNYTHARVHIVTTTTTHLHHSHIHTLQSTIRPLPHPFHAPRPHPCLDFCCSRQC